MVENLLEDFWRNSRNYGTSLALEGAIFARWKRVRKAVTDGLTPSIGPVEALGISRFMARPARNPRLTDNASRGCSMSRFCRRRLEFLGPRSCCTASLFMPISRHFRNRQALEYEGVRRRFFPRSTSPLTLTGTDSGASCRRRIVPRHSRPCSCTRTACVGGSIAEMSTSSSDDEFRVVARRESPSNSENSP